MKTTRQVTLTRFFPGMTGVSVYASLVFIFFLVLVSLLAPVISSDKPVYVNYNGHKFFPAITGQAFADVTDPVTGASKRIHFTEYMTWEDEASTLLRPLVPYAPGKSDLANANYRGPGDYQEKKAGGNGKLIPLSGSERHLLGTGKRGDDVMAGLIHGTRFSLFTGLFSMLIAGIIGIISGALAGYFGDDGLKISRAGLFMLIIGIIPSWFYSFGLRNFILADSLSASPWSFFIQFILTLLVFTFLLVAFGLAGRLFHFIPFMAKEISFRIDSIISRAIEILISLPRIILIISLAAIARPSFVNLVLIIGLTSWTEIARLTRAEMLRVKSLEFIQSARSLGYSNLRIIFSHALPNAIGPATVAIAFGVGSAILAESSLSFLGIGVPAETVTWGSLLAAGRENFNAWWLVVFPGLAIFLTVTSFNLLGDRLRDAMDPRMKK